MQDYQVLNTYMKITVRYIWSTKTYSHFKKRWKTFSAPNASYSNKYLSQFFIKTTITTISG